MEAFEEDCGKDEAFSALAEVDALVAAGKRAFSAPRIPRWTASLAEFTALHRARRAKEHEDEARALASDARLEDKPEQVAVEAGRWHRQRAKGQRERFERVDRCGRDDERVEVCCESCGETTQKHTPCRVGLVCLGCRGLIQAEKRSAFMASRREVLRLAREQGLTHPLRPRSEGGPWTEKFLTFTPPHDDPAQAEHMEELGAEDLEMPIHAPQTRVDARITQWRIAHMRRAWRFFTIRLNKLLRGKKLECGGWEHPGGQVRLPPSETDEQQRPRFRHSTWFRSFEWTPAKDERGHPHFHVWFFGPWLDQAVITGLWKQSLRAVGRESLPERRARKRRANETPEQKKRRKAEARRLARRRTSEPWPMDEALLEKLIPVHIEALRGSEKSRANEVIKYMTKDIVSGGDKISPELYAPVYCELDGFRTTQSTSAFISIGGGREPATCRCGATGTFMVRRVRPDDVPKGGRKDSPAVLEAFGVTRPRAEPPAATAEYIAAIAAALDGGD